MRRWNLSHHAISSWVTAALLAGCGVLPLSLSKGQDDMQPPIGAPVAMPPTTSLAARGDSSNYKVVYSFAGSPDGSFPTASLIEVHGKLYGTTQSGGNTSCAYDCGTVYSLNLNGQEMVLYQFATPPDGSNPPAGLIDMGGTLYGTTDSGGSNTCGYLYYFSCGTVFSVTPSGTEKVLHSFGNPPDGNLPAAGMIDVNGTLYGTTQFGGAYKNNCGGGCGTVFSITPSGTEKVLHSFRGGVPAASLIEVKGKLYGTTSGGGANGWGTVFSITLSGRVKQLHSFGSGTDGANPRAGLIDVDGTLYGTTEVGGARIHRSQFCNITNRCGTVFSITPSGIEKVLHRFVGKGTDGAGPVASLIEVKGTLYGTTASGGAYYEYACGCGTVFSIRPSGTYKLLHSFGSGTDGRGPAAALIDVNGTLYGTTAGGGTHQSGTVFALKP
ncbi:MAG: choice-of-anchor tandem repeat GloVer-containing protein [Candidatus Cybelea sp.]